MNKRAKEQLHGVEGAPDAVFCLSAVAAALEFAASDTRANGAPEDAVLPACEANPLLT